ncbi:MAG: zinc-ribbon domain-containing protein [Fimbriiglobus sp.]
MFCPECRARKPAVEGVRKTYVTLFFIPLFPIASHEPFYRCEGCDGKFDPDARWPYDFGEHASPKLWNCSRCKSPNSNQTYRCKACGTEA